MSIGAPTPQAPYEPPTVEEIETGGEPIETAPGIILS